MQRPSAGLFYVIGNSYGIPYYIKNIIALRRNGIMSLKRPAAGGESCEAGFFLISAYFCRHNKTLTASLHTLNETRLLPLTLAV